MPIKITPMFTCSDGTTAFQTLIEAQAHEIAAMASLAEGFGNADFLNKLQAFIVAHGPEVLSILSADPDAPPRRKPRSDRGKNHAKRNTVPAKEGVA